MSFVLDISDTTFYEESEEIRDILNLNSYLFKSVVWMMTPKEYSIVINDETFKLSNDETIDIKKASSEIIAALKEYINKNYVPPEPIVSDDIVDFGLF